MFLNTDFLKSDELHLILQKTTGEDNQRGWLPAYHFSICNPSGQEMGSCTLRIGHNEHTYYGGNIGYTIKENFRGHHYSGKACILLLELARRHHMTHLFITCDPDNIPSRRNCEYAGGTLLEIARIPKENDMYQRGIREKCIYRIDLL